MARLVRDEGVVLAREDFLETDLLVTKSAVCALLVAFLQTLKGGVRPPWILPPLPGSSWVRTTP